jgi:hypothetical protein
VLAFDADANSAVKDDVPHPLLIVDPIGPSEPVKPGSETVMVSFTLRSTLEANEKLMFVNVDVKRSTAGMLSAVWVSAALNGKSGLAIKVLGIVPFHAVLTETVSENEFPGVSTKPHSQFSSPFGSTAWTAEFAALSQQLLLLMLCWNLMQVGSLTHAAPHSPKDPVNMFR